MSDTLHSIILGSGQPFVILHGFLGMADNWKTLGRQWAEEGREVHLLDQRNHGRSFHSDTFDYNEMAQDVVDYCTEYNLEDIILLGHSMGGKVAMAVAALRPTLIEKLVVADIAPKVYPPHHGDIIKALRSVDFAKVKRRGDADVMLRELIPDYGTRQFLLKSLYRKDKVSYDWRFNLGTLGEVQHRVGSHEPLKGMIALPTLFVRGAKSGYVLDEDMLLVNQIFNNAQLKTVPDAGHWLHAEQPEVFYGTVNNFLEPSS